MVAKEPRAEELEQATGISDRPGRTAGSEDEPLPFECYDDESDDDDEVPWYSDEEMRTSGDPFVQVRSDLRYRYWNCPEPWAAKAIMQIAMRRGEGNPFLFLLGADMRLYSKAGIDWWTIVDAYEDLELGVYGIVIMADMIQTYGRYSDSASSYGYGRAVHRCLSEELTDLYSTEIEHLCLNEEASPFWLPTPEQLGLTGISDATFAAYKYNALDNKGPSLRAKNRVGRAVGWWLSSPCDCDFCCSVCRQTESENCGYLANAINGDGQLVRANVYTNLGIRPCAVIEVAKGEIL